MRDLTKLIIESVVVSLVLLLILDISILQQEGSLLLKVARSLGYGKGGANP
jgi:hypothetical protein